MNKLEKQTSEETRKQTCEQIRKTNQKNKLEKTN